jgi:succinylglutamate desuccinylase
MLNIIDHVPSQLLETPATELYQLLPGPTLMHLKGKRPEPLFVSVLLHGNETTGFVAIQELLKKYQNRELPRALSVFIGNIGAARFARRRLDNQVDYNRVWPSGTFSHDSLEAKMMQQVVEEMRKRNVFVSVDIHNNTGLNPHYGCVNRLDHKYFHLANLFSRMVIYFIRPQGVQSQAFAELCPAVTVECGQPDKFSGVTHALQYIESCLGLSALPEHPVAKHDIDLFHTKAIVKVSHDVNFSFVDQHADLVFAHDLDTLNFTELSAGTPFGKTHIAGQPFCVTNEAGEEVADQYFAVENGEVKTTVPLMPSMLTTDEDVIRKDCLCYIMERMALESI